MKKMQTAEVIHIPEPCSVNWNNMKPSDNGRFCDSCSLTVVDFTKMTNEEIGNYFLNKSGQHVCGRYRNDQVSTPKLIQRRKKWGWLVVAATFIFGAGFISSCRKHVTSHTQGARVMYFGTNEKSMDQQNRINHK
jgi:hypothetical protein